MKGLSKSARKKPSSRHYRKPHVFSCPVVQLYNEGKRKVRQGGIT